MICAVESICVGVQALVARARASPAQIKKRKLRWCLNPEIKLYDVIWECSDNNNKINYRSPH